MLLIEALFCCMKLVGEYVSRIEFHYTIHINQTGGKCLFRKGEPQIIRFEKETLPRNVVCKFQRFIDIIR